MSIKIVGGMSSKFPQGSEVPPVRPIRHRRKRPGVCRNCGLPTKAPFSSARGLTRFHTSESDNTAANILNFNFDRRMEFCNTDTCDKPQGVPPPRKDYGEIRRLAIADLGPNYTTAQYVKWNKGLR